MRFFEFKKFQSDAQKKAHIIRKFEKMREDDPTLDKAYMLIAGGGVTTDDNSPVAQRIKGYLEGSKDPDVTAEVMAWCIKTIPTLGDTNQVNEFVNKLQAGMDYVDVKELCPSTGMTDIAPLESVVDEGIPKELFRKMQSMKFGKSDAGPGEAALAILSTKITYASDADVDEQGGDISIDGVGKVEVKGNQGRLGPWTTIDKSLTKSLAAWNAYKEVKAAAGENMPKGLSVQKLSQAVPEDFPKEEILQAIIDDYKIASFAGNLEIGNPEFRREWNKVCFNAYQADAGFKGLLLIGQTHYTYAVKAEQLIDSVRLSPAQVIYKGNQLRENMPQLFIR
tara:strand:- start:4817 stop:5827 length:1011 start_codon:yes stop_codon:yes gene_type:complete